MLVLGWVLVGMVVLVVHGWQVGMTDVHLQTKGLERGGREITTLAGADVPPTTTTTTDNLHPNSILLMFRLFAVKSNLLFARRDRCPTTRVVPSQFNFKFRLLGCHCTVIDWSSLVHNATSPVHSFAGCKWI
jgi:hypothetical protein